MIKTEASSWSMHIIMTLFSNIHVIRVRLFSCAAPLPLGPHTPTKIPSGIHCPPAQGQDPHLTSMQSAHHCQGCRISCNSLILDNKPHCLLLICIRRWGELS
ncbi:hypothetical protein GDO81_029391 [Engystomops pustulosus]|uniref:Uncharacterized protein n=1 Tax=Engystomops pustulosus TaxID=76066 RepID=A0AAV6ZC47_ENGPU|nr:hypothetical protein GDO81_029391 [Engystomops pustulosus]